MHRVSELSAESLQLGGVALSPDERRADDHAVRDALRPSRLLGRRDPEADRDRQRRYRP